MSKSKNKKRIVISGGHLTPALALIDYIQEEKLPVEIIFFGRLLSQESSKQESQEKKEINSRNIKFVPVSAPRSSTNLFKKAFFIFRLIGSILRALFLLIRYRPKVFVSFGGYLSIPIGLACAILGIPIITHEQTQTAGEANKILAKFAKKVAVSNPGTLKLFPKDKVVLTGNPIRPDLINAKPKRPDWATDLSQDKPTLLVTGGNQGSYILNTTISQILPKLIHSWNVIHACGNPTNKINYKNELKKVKNQLHGTHKNNYIVKEWLTTEELSWVYNTADGIVSRAGANTVQEIAFSGIPAILIPLPFSKGNEQLLNAKNLTDHGAAILLEQKNLSADTLLKEINFLKKHQRSLRRKLEPLKPPTNGAQLLWQLVAELL